MQRAVEITKSMVYSVIDLARLRGCEVIVAPYEADAQMYHLVKSGYAEVAISDDSDLIALGCPVVLFRLKPTGHCTVLDLTEFNLDPELRSQVKDHSLRYFLGFSRKQMIETCVLAGCDYLPNIKGIGIKKATDFMHRFHGGEAVVKHLYNEKSFRTKIPKEYLTAHQKIVSIFLYQRVYDPNTQRLATLSELPADFQDGEMIGEEFENAQLFCEGYLDFETLEERPIVLTDPLENMTPISKPKSKGKTRSKQK